MSVHRMNFLLTAIFAASLALGSIMAEDKTATPVQGSSVHLIWNDVPPFSNPEDKDKKERILDKGDGIVRITDVTEPTLTFFPAPGKGPHPAVLVCPGGGYELLAWTHEGLDICAMLVQNGFSAFLLKYRVAKNRPGAHADAARAMRFIRSYASEFSVDPNKIGAIGFSAGAHLCATIAAPAEPVPYDPVDELDSLSYRPNFVALIYPAYLTKNNGIALQPEFKITRDTPPTFLVQAENDRIRVENVLGWFYELKKAGIPAELHVYPTGGHGYGLRRTGEPIAVWPELAAAWFRRQAGLK